MANQKTIKNKVSISGIALHSGDNTSIVLSPSCIDTGIRFYLNDTFNRKIIEVSAKDVVKTTLSTNIGNEMFSVSTIEHLMSVLHIIGIDNIDITVNGSEIPILDGSALQYYHLLSSAGVKEQNKTKSHITINKDIHITDGISTIRCYPHDGFVVDMKIIFDHPLIGVQHYVFDPSIHDYMTEIAPARTFGSMRDIQIAKENGMIKGGSLENAIVLDHKEVINPPRRFDDEFVRHKILDFIGDLYVEGPIKGWFDVCCSGHGTNNKLMRTIMNDK